MHAVVGKKEGEDAVQYDQMIKKDAGCLHRFSLRRWDSPSRFVAMICEYDDELVSTCSFE